MRLYLLLKWKQVRHDPLLGYIPGVSPIKFFPAIFINIMYLFQGYRSVNHSLNTIHSTHHSTYPPQCLSPRHPIPVILECLSQEKLRHVL